MKERRVLFLVSAVMLFLAIFSTGLNQRGLTFVGIVPTANCYWPPRNITITWIVADGIISNYGSESAYGWLSVYAVEDEWAAGMCIFLLHPFAPEIVPPLPQNFIIYDAVIYNTSLVKLDYNECDLFISGFWKVGNATEHGYYLESNDLFAGELAVTGNWTYFTINIEGFEPIQGNITNYFAKEITVPRTPIGDIDLNGIIDVKDLLVIAACYGAYLGSRRYLMKADLKFDLFIDIKDILIVAPRYGIQY